MVNNNMGATVLIMIAGSEALNNAVDTNGISLFLTTMLPLLMITGILSLILQKKE